MIVDFYLLYRGIFQRNLLSLLNTIFLLDRYDFDTMVKCDDDTIINMSKYHELMKQQDLSVPFFGGVRFGGMPVFRHGR